MLKTWILKRRLRKLLREQGLGKLEELLSAQGWARHRCGGTTTYTKGESTFTITDTLYVPKTSAEANLDIALKALHKLAYLGNEPLLGSSDGNVIAQQAFKDMGMKLGPNMHEDRI